MTIEDTRKEWRANPYTGLVWNAAPDQSGNDQGECKGEFFESPGFPYLAYLKPGKIGKPLWQWPLPAYEKIAADLAYDLECPVPVAQVLDRREEVVDAYPCYCCLSLKEFPQRYAWSLCMPALAADAAKPVVGELIRGALARASGMLVLDTWLGQGDRGDHPNNVQFSYDPSAPARSQFTYLDFARIFDCDGKWKTEGWKNVQLAKQPTLLMNGLDKILVAKVLEKIMSMSKEVISEICTRLTGTCFTPGQAEEVASGLIGRRDLLRPVISPYI